MSAWKPTHTTRLPSDCSYAKDLRSSDLLPLNHLYMALFDVFLFFFVNRLHFSRFKMKKAELAAVQRNRPVADG